MKHHVYLGEVLKCSFIDMDSWECLGSRSTS